ncbi:MAG: polysaccharide biosynthesis protein [Bacillota bacterium]|nr:polysaccharide biosynthesis protein [Bacillota bacterium]
MSKKKTFLRGAVILGAAGIVIKVLGAIFRIPLGNMLGDEGMSYYQTAYPMYLLLITISTAGFPTAIAKMISEKKAISDYRTIKKIFKVAFYLMTSLGMISFIALYFGSETIVRLVKNDPESVFAMKAMAPALLFVSMMSVFRGFFQGLQDLKPYAISQIVEQFFRVILGLSLAVLLIDKSIAYAAAGATFGAAVGGFFGLIFMVIYYLRSRDNIFEDKMLSNESEESSFDILKKLLLISIPITMGAAVIPIMNIIDLGIVMRRLHSIGIIEQANDLYGQLTGYANALTNLPAIITVAFQISLVPAISSLKITSRKQLESTIETAIRISVIIGLPAAVGLVTLSRGIMMLLYPSQIEIVNSVSRILSVLGWGVAFLSIFQISTGILQGLDKQSLPAKNLFVGAIVKLILSYVLIGIPEINILGAAMSTVAAYSVAALLNLKDVFKYSNVKPNIKKMFLKPIIVSAIMGIFVKSTYYFGSIIMSLRIATIIAIFVGIITYVVFLFVLKVITEDDLELVPYGDKLKRFVRKIS